MIPMGGENPIVFVDSAPWFGGAQRSLLTLLEGLSKRGRSVRLIGADGTEHGLLDSCRNLGIHCADFQGGHWGRSVRGLFSFLVARKRFRQTWRASVKADTPALVHANGLRAGLLVMGCIPNGVPLVVHERDSRAPEALRRVVANRADHVITVSKYLERSLRDNGVTVGLSVVYNGLEVDRIRNAMPASQTPWTNQHLTVIDVGDMVSWKRHELFLQSIRQGLSTIPELRGIIVGRPLTDSGARLLSSLRRLTDILGLTEHVRFVTAADDAVPWIAAADVLVSTADGEPFGRTIVEALAVGKPVVVTRGGGPEEIVGDSTSGRVVDDGPEAIAEGIRQFREASVRRLVRDEAVRRAGEFTADRMVEATMAVYERLLEA